MLLLLFFSIVIKLYNNPESHKDLLSTSDLTFPTIFSFPSLAAPEASPISPSFPATSQPTFICHSCLQLSLFPLLRLPLLRKSMAQLYNGSGCTLMHSGEPTMTCGGGPRPHPSLSPIFSSPCYFFFSPSQQPTCAYLFLFPSLLSFINLTFTCPSSLAIVILVYFICTLAFFTMKT